MRSSVLYIVLLTAHLSAGSFSIAQITRDVGEIAVIEGDDLQADPKIIIPPTDPIGNPCPGNPALTVDVEQVAKTFYQSHEPVYQALILFSNFPYTSASSDAGCNEPASTVHSCNVGGGTFARAATNTVSGIHKEICEFETKFGSNGTLEVMVSMNSLPDPNDPTNPPPDPNEPLNSNTPYSMMSLLGQEVGHRWGSSIEFDSDPGPTVVRSDALLGRGLAHWSFFFHAASVTSDATTMEASSLAGTNWQINASSPEFQSVPNTDGFCQLDLYLMGLLPESDVEPFWYIADPFNVSPPASAVNPPRTVTTTAEGDQTWVNIGDVIAVEGHRVPHYANSPKIFRQAFILLTRQEMDVTRAELDQVERYRVAWEKYFGEKTQDRGAVITNLDDVVFVDRANTCPVPLRDCDGTVDDPFPSVAMGQFYTPAAGTLAITAGIYPENLTLSKEMTLRAVRGTVTIGG